MDKLMKNGKRVKFLAQGNIKFYPLTDDEKDKLSNYDGLKNQISDLQTQNDELQSTNSDLQSQVSEWESSYNNAESQLSSIQSQYNYLQNFQNTALANNGTTQRVALDDGTGVKCMVNAHINIDSNGLITIS